jgi:hypothetical protein
VSEALEKMVGMEEVEGISEGQSETWHKQFLDILPRVLILHLKCFHYKEQTCSKIVKSLEYPIDLKLDQSESFYILIFCPMVIYLSQFIPLTCDITLL